MIDLGSRIKDRGSRIKDPRSRTQDPGSNNDLGSRIKDLIITQERLRNDSGMTQDESDSGVTQE